MKRRVLLTLAMVLIALFPLSVIGQQPDNVPPGCKEWFATVDPSQGASVGWVSPSLKDATVLKAIDCLLLLHGNKKPAGISGATNFRVSQMLPDATVELAALYYISYLFTGNREYCDGIALWNDHGVINPDGSIETAYSAYAAWFKQVKSMGLQEARKQKLNALRGTGLAWYGNCPGNNCPQ